MHKLAVEAIVNSVQKRVAQGDCPTEPPQSLETLEEVICALARERLMRQIRNDPDDNPCRYCGGWALDLIYHELHCAMNPNIISAARSEEKP